jgi:ribosomal protein S18 acetylase RimI-like enzyme
MGLWDESARAGFAELLPPDHLFPEADRGRFEATLGSAEVSVLVAEEGGELVGFAACGANRDADAGAAAGEVRTFFVAPSSWRRGVGRALMRAALEDLRRRGYLEATVWSFAENERANAFYESQGFRPDGAERREEAWAGILELRLRRPLA